MLFSLSIKNFYPRPPWGGRLRCCAPGIPHLPISIHALRGEGDPTRFSSTRYCLISIHALRGEGDGDNIKVVPASAKFLSTPSVGRATCTQRLFGAIFGISIHALRGEGDFQTQQFTRAHPRISIHALRGEGDPVLLVDTAFSMAFLSTPSVGRATFVAAGNIFGALFLSTPSVGRATYGNCGTCNC